MTRKTSFDEQLSQYGDAADVRVRETGSWLGFTSAAGAAECMAPLAAVGLACLGATDAQAAIIHSEPATPLVFAFTSTSGPAALNVGFNLDGAGPNDISFSLYGYGFSSRARVRITPGPAQAAISAGVAANLATGVPLPGTQSFVGNLILNSSNLGTSLIGNFPDGSYGFLGVQFPGDGGSMGTQYAWLRIRVTTESIGSARVEVFEWAYEDTGATIEVGAIPEPSSLATASLGLLALGAAGVSHYRKKKAAAA